MYKEIEISSLNQSRQGRASFLQVPLKPAASAHQRPAFEQDQQDYHGTAQVISPDAAKIAHYAQAAQLTDILVTWILIADKSHAQIYECQRSTQQFMSRIAFGGWGVRDDLGYGLAPVPDGMIEAEMMNDYQFDKNSNSDEFVNRHGDKKFYDVYHEIQHELDQRFIRAIAKKLQTACEKNLFDRLVLAVPVAMAKVLKEQFSEQLRGTIVGFMPRNDVAR